VVYKSIYLVCHLSMLIHLYDIQKISAIMHWNPISITNKIQFYLFINKTRNHVQMFVSTFLPKLHSHGTTFVLWIIDTLNLTLANHLLSSLMGWCWVTLSTIEDYLFLLFILTTSLQSTSVPSSIKWDVHSFTVILV